MEKKNNNKQSFGFRFNIFWMYAIIGLVLVGIYYSNSSSTEKNINWQPDFKKYLTEGFVKSIVVYPEKGQLEVQLDEATTKKVFKDYKQLDTKKAKVIVQVPYSTYEDYMKHFEGA